MGHGQFYLDFIHLSELLRKFHVDMIVLEMHCGIGEITNADFHVWLN